MTEFLTVLEGWNSYQSLRTDRVSEVGLANLNEALHERPDHVSYWLDGIRRGVEYRPLAEAVGVGDFPGLFGALVDRELLAAYKALNPDWRSFIKVGSVPNFNVHEYHKIAGQDNVLPQVAEFAPYLETPSVTGHYDRQVFKWGRRFGISFEALINDSLGAFRDISQRFLTAVQRTEARNAALGFVAATGPSPALFGAPIADVDGQNVTNLGVLPLTITNLQTTLELMARQTDAIGSTIAMRGVHLVVPPTLEFTARQILTSAYVQQVDTAGGANAAAPVFVPLPTSNVLPQYGIKLHVFDECMAIDATATDDTTWYVFADPSQAIACGLDYLRGHETPEICQKSSNKLSVGGGAISELEGDFDTDEIAYRVRTIHGHWHGDPRACYAQVGP